MNNHLWASALILAYTSTIFTADNNLAELGTLYNNLPEDIQHIIANYVLHDTEQDLFCDIEHACTLEGHTDSVSGIAFSPDGKQIATASDDTTARIYNIIKSFEKHKHTLSPSHKLWLYLHWKDTRQKKEKAIADYSFDKEMHNEIKKIDPLIIKKLTQLKLKRDSHE